MTSSTIGTRIDEFIAYKRRLGYVYDTQERYLKHYQKHMDENYPLLALPIKKARIVFLISSRDNPEDCITL